MGNLLQYGNSVTLYAACFLLSAALAGLAQLYERRTRPIRLSPNGWQGTRPALVLWALSLAVPLLLSSLRWEVGTDYVTYGQLYTSLNQIDTLGEFVYQLPITEPGYILLNFFVKAVFNTPVMVYAICALITLFFFYRAIEDYHEKGSVMLAALVFFALFYSVTLNIMRQMIAVSIMFFATRYLFRQKYYAAAAWAVVAASFHVTALVVVVFWVIRGEQRWQKIARIAVFSALIAFLFGSIAFGSVIDHIPFFSTLSLQPQSPPGFGLLLLRVPIFVPLLLFRKRLVAHDERNRLWLIFLVFEVAFSHLGYIDSVFIRLALYFAVSWIVLLPQLVRCMPTRSDQYRMGAYVVLVLAALWVFDAVISNNNDVLPYKSLFDAINIA